MSLQARQAALSTGGGAPARCQQCKRTDGGRSARRQLYAGVERNVYIFLAAMLIVIVLTSLYLVQYNRRLFEQVAELSDRRSELAQQLISMQENTFRSISRELHDDFGQILTAIGAMLQRADKRPGDLLEVREIVQTTLEKVRALSHALHPVVLDEVGLESALDVYLPGFERQTGIAIRLREDRPEPRTGSRTLDSSLPRDAGSAEQRRAAFRLEERRGAPALSEPNPSSWKCRIEASVFAPKDKQGLGLVSMRERAEMMRGAIDI